MTYSLSRARISSGFGSGASDWSSFGFDVSARSPSFRHPSQMKTFESRGDGTSVLTSFRGRLQKEHVTIRSRSYTGDAGLRRRLQVFFDLHSEGELVEQRRALDPR